MFIMLVSRRAVKQGLTQLEARGLDNEGNTGNFVETELILQIR